MHVLSHPKQFMTHRWIGQQSYRWRVAIFLLLLIAWPAQAQDDTAYIQNMLDTQDVISLPAGKYYISSPLIIGEKMFKGEGKKETEIVAIAPMPYMLKASSNAKISDMYFNGNVSAEWGILYPGGNGSHTVSVRVRFCTKAGFVLGNTQNSFFMDCDSYDNLVCYALYNHAANNTFIACDANTYWTLSEPGGAFIDAPDNVDARHILMAYKIDPNLPAPQSQKNRHNRFISGIYERDMDNLYSIEMSYAEANNSFIGIEVTGGCEPDKPQEALIYLAQGNATFYDCKLNHDGGKTAIVDGGYLKIDKTCIGGGLGGSSGLGASFFPKVDVRAGGDSNAMDYWNGNESSNTRDFSGGMGSWHGSSGGWLVWDEVKRRLHLTSTSPNHGAAVSLKALSLNLNTEPWMKVSFVLDNILPTNAVVRLQGWNGSYWSTLNTFTGNGEHTMTLKLPADVGELRLSLDQAGTMEIVHFDYKLYGAFIYDD